jgi:tRNA pseudouridine13 synthase
LIVPRLEKQMGIEVYGTRSPGIGGEIRRGFEDFVVEELLVDGSKASVAKPTVQSVLGSSSAKDRFLLCILVKRNWDTISAVKAVADQLAIGTSQVQFAGLKDTRAITAQHITIEGATADEVSRVKVKDIELRPVGYVRNGLSQFYLLGNSFRLRIRGISHSESTVRRRINRVIEEASQLGGFPNFFGHQRFGTTRPITHLVGQAIVKGNFEKAAMLFLARPSPTEHPDSRRARQALQATRDFKKALKDYPKQLRFERLMLRHLAVKPDDYIGAFRRLPPRLLELFPQAYQSYLFNRVLSRRLMQGFRLNTAEAGDIALNVERSGLPMPTMHKVVDDENISEVKRGIEAGKMRLAIALIGYKHKHTIGTQGKIENEILEEENVTPRDFKVKAVPELSLRGNLRTATIALNNFDSKEITADVTNRTKLVANLTFTLHKGSYATIVLREMMKPRNLLKAGF